ncbi:MAG: DUF4440 domain-containing protein [Gemmatimonadetes bacterium]|nr:DUF4440 domain-containing protein [Gemmatimonadota bacterium]
MATRLVHDETPPPVEMNPEAEEDQIRELGFRWTKAVARRDARGLSELLSERAVMLPPNGDSIKGAEEISRAWQRILALPGFRMTFEPQRTNVYPTGDVAHDISRYRLAWNGPDGRPVRDHGNHLIVWERCDPDGSWKVRSNVFYSRSLDGACPLSAC